VTSGKSTQPAPASGYLSWLVTSVLVGWFVVYNIMRIRGDSPRGAALVSLAIGAAAGLVVFAVGLAVRRRLVAAGWVRPRRGTVEVPGPDALDTRQRDALRVAGLALAALAAVALVVGLAVGIDWLRAGSLHSHYTKLILAVWDLLMAAWLVSELPRIRRGEGEGIDSLALAAGLTSVLAGVGLSREVVPAAQGVLIVVSGVAAATAAFAAWRLEGGRGAPLAAIAAVVVAALSLILPLVS